MQNLEIKNAVSVAVIFFCRMMGLFMVLPVLGIYGLELEGATPLLLGLAVGAYGITQAGLQIPFAILSDVFGRKRIMLMGLSLFLLGSVLAIFADTIWLLIVSRLLQGSGAIAAVSMAYLADNSREQTRARVMALVGIAIGASFVAAIISGPLIASGSGLQGVFIFSAILASVALLICWFFVSDTARRPFKESWLSFKALDAGEVLREFSAVLKLKGVIFFSLAVFSLHAVMTSSFIVIPVLLETYFELNRELHWKFFLGVFLVSVILMGPFARPSSDTKKLKSIFNGCVVILFLTLLGLGTFSAHSFYIFIALLVIFFTAFNLLEAMLPSLLSIVVDEHARARAMGVYSSFQFSGAFAGGLLAGIVMQTFTLLQVFLVSALLVLVVSILLTLTKRY